MAAKCHVVGCTKPSIAKGLCNTHYKRQYRNGSQETLRPEDWGDRRKHTSYPQWKILSRDHRTTTDPRWIENFWTFAKEVPPKPEEGKTTGSRPDPNKPWSKDNFYWKESRFGDLHRSNKAEYMRKWQQSMRDADPDYGKNKDLLRHYGVTLKWLNAKRIEQGDKCAICRQPETLVIRGRVMTLAVDHCHGKGHVRELLCSKCNQGLGCFGDDTERLRAAAAYLEKHRPESLITDLV